MFKLPNTSPDHFFALLGTDRGGFDTSLVDPELPLGAPFLPGDISVLPSELFVQSLWTEMNEKKLSGLCSAVKE